jgi:hypothetical protein
LSHEDDNKPTDDDGWGDFSGTTPGSGGNAAKPEESTTDKPSTAKPSTAKPSTVKPTTAKPSTVKPSTAKPSTAKPSTAKPTTDKPTTDKPSSDKPKTDVPATKKKRRLPRFGAGSDGGGGWPRSRWILLACAAALLVTAGILGYFNSKKYYFTCDDSFIAAERGRFFPWGRAELSGKKWEHIPIGPEVRCGDSTVASEDELTDLFARAIIDRATDMLGRDDKNVDLEEAARRLDQALLLTRAPDSERRKKVDNLRGDLAYRRAQRRYTSGVTALREAAALYEKAATHVPVHTRDGATWSEFTTTMAGELDKGPHELCEETPVPAIPDTPPPEPEQPAHPPVSSEIDAGPPPPQPPPDPNKGGVLL